MGENTKVKESTADALREQIRHTEGHITETVHDLEERLSPRFLRQRGARQAKRLAWQATAKLLEFAQRPSVQASLVGGGALWMLIRNRKVRGKLPVSKTAAAPERRHTGSAAKAAGATALWLLSRKGKAVNERPARKHVSGIVLAATAAKAFLTGARASAKSGNTRPGRKVAWSGLATAIAGALGSYWYRHRERRA